MKPSTYFSASAVAAVLSIAALGCDGGGDGGSAGSTGGGGSGGNGPAPPLAESCETICDKQGAQECAQFTADQCKQQCPFLEQSVEAGCKTEWETLYGCQAGLEYTCTNGQLTPVGSEICYEETLAMQECNQKLPCIKYCTKVVDSGCLSATDQDTCISKCVAETNYTSNSPCTFEIAQLRNCQGNETSPNIECKSGNIVTVNCDSQVSDYAQCIENQEADVCEGYCVAAELSGCAPNGLDACLLTCQEEKHAGSSCDFYYGDLLDCRMSNGLDCSSGTVSDANCQSELMSYQLCVNP